jgi:NCS1 family nucleobase:cation symporter-1
LSASADRGAAGAGAPGEAASVFGRMPLLPAEREYRSFGAHATCFAYAIATWCLLVGGYAAERVGAVEGTICLLAGNLVGVFLTTMPLSLGCQRYGLEQIDFCKTAFGQHGAHVILLFYLINMLGWSGLLLVMFGNGMSNIGEAVGLAPGEWIVGAGVAIGIWLAYLIAAHGVHRLNVVNRVITPGLGIIVASMLYLLFDTYGWEAVASAPPLDPLPDPRLNYAIVFELGIANGFSWWGGIAFLSRNTRSRRNSVYPEILQLGLASGMVSSVALCSALMVGSADPTRWMVPLGGLVMGVMALALVGLANVSSIALSLFASGLALRHIPALRRRPWWQIIVITIVPCAFFVVWPQQLYDLGDAFLAYNGTMYAPISGILFVDYFWLRRQRICLRSIFDDAPHGAYYYWRGFNLLALGCIVAGQAAYFWLYNPLSARPHELFLVVPASLAAFAVPAVLYGLGMRILGIRLAADAPAGRLVSPNI